MSVYLDDFTEGLVRLANVIQGGDPATHFFRGYISSTTAAFFRSLMYIGDNPTASYVDFIWWGKDNVVTDEIQVDVWDGAPTNGLTANGPVLTPGEHTFAYTREPAIIPAETQHRFWVDGVLVLTIEFDMSAAVLTHMLLGTDTFDGARCLQFLDSYMEFNFAMTAAQIAAQHASPTVPILGAGEGLVAWAPLVDDLIDVINAENNWAPVTAGGEEGEIDFVPFPAPPITEPTVTVETYSDLDMHCPAGYENGHKEGIVEKFGGGERRLSHPWTGERYGATFAIRFADDRRFRERLADPNRRYPTVWDVKMTTRDNRAALGLWWTVFVGPVVGIRPYRPQGIEFILGDLFSDGLLSDSRDQDPIPFRVIRDGFLSALDSVSATLDLDTPEHIIYGIHRRIPDEDPPSPQGFQWIPTYLGIETIDSVPKHVWMVAGHACADIPDVLIWTHDDQGGLLADTSVLADGDWEIPHTSAPDYEDRRSDTYGTLRRYTLIRALVGNEDADAVVAGEKTLAVFVDGIEPVGDGSGAVIQERILQFKHFMINFVAHKGQNSYHTGAWKTSPTYDLFGVLVPVIDEASFDTANAIAVGRLEEGYQGAVIIGATAGDRDRAPRWVADAARSCGLRYGQTHFGQFRVGFLSPTAAIKAAAPLYTDAYHMLRGSFETDYPLDDKVNRVPWKGDYEYSSGQYKTSGTYVNDEGVRFHGGKAITGDTRDYPWAPGITAMNHLAVLESRVRMHPRTVNRFAVTVGPDHKGDSLGYRDLFDYIRYRAYPAVSTSTSEIRLGQIVGHQVQAGARTVLVDVLDCEELIDYDAPVVAPAPPAEGTSATCETAVDIPEATATGVGGYSITVDTSESATDAGAPVTSCGGGTAYHAYWAKYTPTYAQKGHITTGLSDYDTVLAVFTGTCGELEELACNDNDGIFKTSFIEFTGSGPMIFEAGVTHYILVHGYGPADGGTLVLTMFAEPL